MNLKEVKSFFSTIILRRKASSQTFFSLWVKFFPNLIYEKFKGAGWVPRHSANVVPSTHIQAG